MTPKLVNIEVLESGLVKLTFNLSVSFNGSIAKREWYMTVERLSQLVEGALK